MIIKDEETGLEKIVTLFKVGDGVTFINELNKYYKTEWFYNKEIEKLVNKKVNWKNIIKVKKLVSEIKREYININTEFVENCENIMNEYFAQNQPPRKTQKPKTQNISENLGIEVAKEALEYFCENPLSTRSQINPQDAMNEYYESKQIQEEENSRDERNHWDDKFQNQDENCLIQ